ncbi:FepA family TonB-dependent siderophore receptor [Celeribacter indicus]|uniref:Outer membrane receptor FepA n=1 Tax=Celeribacter indicus TaxID=1208324 RepID=A0A0B5DVU1_9RHOB|nr:FepA family TonB-dependent siderophore receptor [Celeribacter indicus]AJE47114.1 outer membrane receptor FepA [Celeribacter indicus]SDW90496.1 ferric enterobactin receptor [Celeribacter indicus]
MRIAGYAARSGTALGLLLSATLVPAVVAQESEEIMLDPIVITAEEQIKQALGVSQISAEDLESQPVTNDLSEVIRRMPGVNLTGNSASGQRGNQRQIDIRGMGPENVLILIDGKPVTSRNASRMGRQGERDTRGDSNWVPPELVERIEVIRGPAAARYGSGAAGGVVNIITKKPDEPTVSAGLHFDIPESELEGVTRRMNLLLAGPINDRLSYRLYGNYNKTGMDSADINDGDAAGSEGVTNRDIGGLLRWDINENHSLDFEFGYSEQWNAFAGETGFGSGVTSVISADNDGDGVEDTFYNVYGEKTNSSERKTLALTHRGSYAFGESHSFIQWENTLDSRLCPGLNGGGEGTLSFCVDRDGNGVRDDVAFIDTEYDAISAKTEWYLPGTVMGREASYTFGGEFRGEKIDQTVPEEVTDRDTRFEFRNSDYTSQKLYGIYAEANILASEQLTLTPALRYDYSDRFGDQLSPSLNATWEFDPEWSMKVGVAQAFKAPNLFQLNPDYYYNTRGRGCPAGYSGPCRIRGNDDLQAETSINKEIGFAYEGDNGINGSLTYFHNDYKDRIAADVVDGETDPDTGGSVFQWNNVPEAVVSGMEGNFYTPIGDDYAFNANVTYMIESKNKQTGNPLSLVPDYTINAAFDWQATDDLLVTLSATHYGRIPTITRSLSQNEEITDEDALTERDPYTLFNLAAKWDISEASYVTAGVTNLFDKQIKRTSEGSETFNEPGRGFYIGLQKSF